jgi:protein tyrosine phosphatase (PTP) superfamily phosphohydrolase (DUF442 family)
MSTATIYNYIKVDDQIITGGQPTADQLKAAAAEGVVTVINLATLSPGHSLEDEAGLVQALGLTYIHIPVEWDHPRPEDFDAFERAMAGRPAGLTLLHCAANYRVTAFYSLYAQKHLGWSEAQADAFRAQIWAGSHYPVWDKLIADIKARIANQGSRAAGG